MSPPLKTIFIGPFVHCKSLEELDICEHGAIGVNEKGVIAFIERDVEGGDADPVAKKHGWVNPKVIRIYDTGFFFPGFIGTFKSRKFDEMQDQRFRSKFYANLMIRRYTHTRLPIPKRRYLRQINSLGLVEYIHLPPRIFPARSLPRKTRLQPRYFPDPIPWHNYSSILCHNPRTRNKPPRRHLPS
jgi:hypothetical protein